MAKSPDHAPYATHHATSGETHQSVPTKGPHDQSEAHLTTNQGVRVSDNQNSLKAGARAGVARRFRPARKDLPLRP
jgi:catalase